MIPPVRVRVMGAPGVADAEGHPVSLPTGKPLALLYYLSRHPDGVLRDDLADLLWPDRTRKRALHSLRQALWRIRKELSDRCMVDDDPVRLAPGFVESDVDRMLQALDEGDLPEALAWWASPPLARLRIRDAPAWDRWADAERESLERRLLLALEEEARAAVQRGDAEHALRWADEAVERGPWRAPAHELRIEALIQLRDQPAAREALARARQDLPESESLDSLEERIRGLGVPRSTDPGEVELRTPFVGRRTAWGELLTAWGRARDQGARIALITGDEGSGRSRLATELARTAEEDGARVLELSLIRTQRTLAYSTVRDLSRKLFPLSGAAGISHASDRILQSLVPSLAVGVPDDVSIPDGVLVADALMDLIGAVAEDGPLVLHIDGVQWLDPASAEILTPVLRDLGSLPVLILLTPSGPERGEGLPFPFLERHTPFLRLDLDPLSQREIRELVEHLLEPSTADEALTTLARRLHRASGGVPGRIVELLHHLRSVGALLPRPEGRWKLEHQRIPSRSELRKALARHEPPSRRLPHGLAAAVVLLLLLMAGALLPLRPAGEAPWGGGTLVAIAIDHAVLLTPAAGPLAGWTQTRQAPATPLAESRLEFLLADGTFVVSERSADEKPWLSLRGPGGIQTLLRTEGDDFIRGLSPDGREALVVSEPVDEDPYRLDLWRVPIGGGEREPLVEAQEAVRAPTHSPDGRRLAMVTVGPVDSLLVLSAGGDRLLAIPLQHSIEALTWCAGNGGLVGIRSDPEPDRLVRIDPATGSMEPLGAQGFPGRDLVCSPDGRGLVYTSAVNGRIRWVLQDLETGSTDLLDPPVSRLRRFLWIPPSPPPTPEALALFTGGDDPVDGQLHLEWGESRPTAIRVRWSDGELRDPDGALRWVSDDPTVADVSAGGILYGNGPGETTLRAVWDGWLELPLQVVVQGSEPEGAILQDPLTSLDPAFWRQVGYPPARIVEREGESVLLLDGDALYLDGIVTRNPVALPRGGTVELDFRMTLTRPDKQWFWLCLIDGTLPDRESFEESEIRKEQSPCIRVPNAQFSGLNPEGFRIRPESGFATLDFRAPDHLPAEEWTHIALQLRPDGTVEVFLNRTLVATSPVRLHKDDEARWHVLILGSSYETEVLARNFAIWDGPRY